MVSKFQLLAKKCRKKKRKKIKKLYLAKNPQLKGYCLRVFTMSPKKPNSANRRVAKVLMLANKRKTVCHIPGIKHTLQKFSTVLIRGCRLKDLPGVKYRAIRGKYDLKRVYDRTKARSKYGIPKN